MEGASWWPALLRPAPLSRYADIFSSFLRSSSFPAFVAYLAAANLLPRWWKRNVPPVESRAFEILMVVYNLVISLINVYCFLGFLSCLARADSIYGREFDPELQSVYYVYWVTKMVELFDTAFMLLRHRFRQISPLHVYHHASMLLLSDLGCSRYSWAAFALPLMLNSLVHVFLYAYYGAAAAKVRVPDRWKRALTEMQILQFGIDLLYAAPGFLFHGFCVWSVGYGASMLWLFAGFYKKAYLSPKKQASVGEKKEN